MATTPVFSDEQIASILDLINTTRYTRHTQYIGARYVPIFGRKGEATIEWDNMAPYEPLTIVLHQGNSYTSRQFVPTGIDIHNDNFWANTGNYNAQVEQYRQTVEQYRQTVEQFDSRITDNTTNTQAANNKLSSMGINSNEDANNFKNTVETNTANIATNTEHIATNTANIALINEPDEMLCFGDSWTFGHGVEPNEKWTTIVANNLNLIEHNYGVSGSGYVYQTSYGNFITEINTAINDPNVNKNKVKYITLFGGINDLNQNRVTPENMVNGAKQCIELIRANWPHAKLIVGNINDNMGVYFGSTAHDASQKMSALQYSYPITFIPNPNTGLALNHAATFNGTTGHPSAGGHRWLAQVFLNAMTGGPAPQLGQIKQSITLFSNLNSNGESNFTSEDSVIYSTGGNIRINCQLSGEVVVPSSTVDIIIGTIGDSYNQAYPFTAARGTWPNLRNYVHTTVTDSVSNTSLPVSTYMTADHKVHVIERGGTSNDSGNKGIKHFALDFPIDNCFDAFI